MRRLLLSMFALFLLTGAGEPILVPDVSQRKIDIVYSFTGVELLLFGAILYPDGRVPSRDADIAVVLRGPTQPLIVREKQKILGLIWANADSTRFLSAPGYYAVASSRPLAKLVDPRTAAIYELGLGNLQLSPGDAAALAERKRLEIGLVDLRRKSLLYSDHPNAVEITDGVLYRARLYLPARVPTGVYTAETYLIRNGRVLAVATRDVRIGKSGFERFVANAAEHSPVSYGLVAISLSLLLGVLASMISRRF